MFMLFGVFDLGCGQGESVSTVAEFSSHDLAKEYLKHSYLANPRRDGSKFRKNSLLSHYHDAYIEYVETDFPFDPVM